MCVSTTVRTRRASHADTAMSHFFCRLNAPRRTFADDMTGAERLLMLQHAAYWQELLGKGQAELFGMVADPGGAWGIAIANVEDRSAVDRILDRDPVILADRGFRYDVFVMPRGAIVRAPRAR